MSTIEPEDATVIDADGTEVEPEQGTPATTAALVPVGVPVTAVVRPIATVATIREAFTDYQAVKNAVITAEDIQDIGSRKFVKKSGWRKLAVAMGVSAELQTRTYDRDEQGRVIQAEVIVRAIAPNGRSMDGMGICDYRERCCPRAYATDAVCKNGSKYHTHCTLECDGFNHFSKPQHDLPATAFTRALNRACSDLFGFGEVSAEEVTDREDPVEPWEGQVLLAAMNAITDESQRKGVKMAFVTRFGKPDELTRGQYEAARRFVKAALPEGEEIPDAPAPTSAPSHSEGKPSEAGDAGERVGAGPENASPAENPGGTTTEPLVDPPVTEPAQAQATPPREQQPPAAREKAPPEPVPQSKPSTSSQKQRIAILFNELGAAGLLKQGDKAEIVGIITHDRATSTIDMFEEEATKMISTLAFLKAGDLAMVDDPDTSGARALQAITERGSGFLAPIAAPADSPVYG